MKRKRERKSLRDVLSLIQYIIHIFYQQFFDHQSKKGNYETWCFPLLIRISKRINFFFSSTINKLFSYPSNVLLYNIHNGWIEFFCLNLVSLPNSNNIHWIEWYLIDSNWKSTEYNPIWYCWIQCWTFNEHQQLHSILFIYIHQFWLDYNQDYNQIIIITQLITQKQNTDQKKFSSPPTRNYVYIEFFKACFDVHRDYPRAHKTNNKIKKIILCLDLSHGETKYRKCYVTIKIIGEQEEKVLNEMDGYTNGTKSFTSVWNSKFIDFFLSSSFELSILRLRAYTI